MPWMESDYISLYCSIYVLAFNTEKHFCIVESS